MANIDLWRHWMQDASSPETFIDFGWLFLIGASLQRRVWCGPEKFPIFPNEYIIFVGDSGVGKGLVLKHVTNVLKYHKIKSPTELKLEQLQHLSSTSTNNVEQPNHKEVQGINQSDLNMLLEMQEMANDLLHGVKNNNSVNNKQIKEAPFVIPIAPDAVTYEQLVHRLSKSTRGISYKVFDETQEKEVQKIYTYTSLCFCLEEIGSLLRKRTEDTANFLLNTWDCGDYLYETKNSGIDRIKKCCLSLLAGTTPTFMRKVFTDELLAEGIAGRTIFIYEYANRFNRLRFPEYSKEQLLAYRAILDHIKKLTTLYGEVKFTKEADEWLDKYLYEDLPKSRANRHPKLGPYYAKKNLHIQKISMAIHFSDCATMECPISLETCMKAAKALEHVEKKMHFAVSLDNKNPLSQTSRNVLEYLKKFGPQRSKDLLLEFFGDVREAELREIIQFLITTKKIEYDEGYYKYKEGKE